ncbi:GFA family protein [Vibrio owensii]
MGYTGSCLCGNVQVKVNGTIKHVMHCHCEMCRKAHGAAFASFGLVSKDNLHISGTEYIRSYKSSPNVTRTFCSVCGSNIEWSDNTAFNKKYRSFALGLLDTDLVPSSEEHIFESSRVSWGKHCVNVKGGS